MPGASRTVGGAVLLAAAVVSTLISSPPSALGQSARVAVNPATGPVGSRFDVSWDGFDRCRGGVVVLWDDDAIAASHDAQRGVLTTAVPRGEVPGGHEVRVVSRCGDGASARFEVTAPPTPVTTQPSPQLPPRLTTAPPPPTTTPPPVTTTTTATATTSSPTTTSTPATTSTTAARAPAPSSRTPSAAALVLTSTDVQLGGTLAVRGSGCAPLAPVRLTVQDGRVGETTADDRGAFDTSVRLADVPSGQQVLRAECGIVLSAVFDVTTPSTSGGPVAGTAVLLLVVLALSALVAAQFVRLRRGGAATGALPGGAERTVPRGPAGPRHRRP
ncbi:hypothetical protein [Umezawaea beigongshangensis]|uniref:hypothetical protein n=1 Tax=Umezawaea beigongshangensis TaxID=2780383 RepID=UPI0018F185DA|nr:hypothetical protein [Umezawaea beigongshangensis]